MTFLTLVRMEVYRFWRLIGQTVFPSLMTTVLFILIFGYSMGSRIQEVHGFSYINYLFPGLVAMGVITNAYANTIASLFMARLDKSIDNILSTPVKPVELVVALVLGAVLRGLLIGFLVLAIGFCLLGQTPSHWIGLLYFLLTSSISFGCLGIVSALMAKTFDNTATLQNFVLTPLVYLAGVFYSVSFLPPFWKTISQWNPLFYLVDGIRWGILGITDANIAFAASFCGILAVVLLFFCVWLFRIGFRLVR